MKKRFINYLFLILMVIGINFLSFIFAFLFYEIDITLNRLLDYSSILFFLVSSIIIAKFISYKSLSIIKCMIIVYITVTIARLCEILVFDSSIGITWCSIGAINTMLDLFLKQSEEYLYWWTGILFPLAHPLAILCFYKLFSKNMLSNENTDDLS